MGQQRHVFAIERIERARQRHGGVATHFFAQAFGSLLLRHDGIEELCGGRKIEEIPPCQIRQDVVLCLIDACCAPQKEARFGRLECAKQIAEHNIDRRIGQCDRTNIVVAHLADVPFDPLADRHVDRLCMLFCRFEVDRLRVGDHLQDCELGTCADRRQHPPRRICRRDFGAQVIDAVDHGAQSSVEIGRQGSQRNGAANERPRIATRVAHVGSGILHPFE